MGVAAWQAVLGSGPMVELLRLVPLLLAGLLAVYAALLCRILWTFRHPPRRTYAGAIARGRPGDPGEFDPPIPFEAWSFDGKRHRLPVWDMAGLDPSGPCVLVTHGWSDARLVSMARAVHLRAAASRVVVWDLPGHGDAPGACRLGVDEAEDLVRLVEGIGGSDAGIVLYGFSLGSGITLDAAARLSRGAVGSDGGRLPVPVGVIAEAPYRDPRTPSYNVLEEFGIPRWARAPLMVPGLGLLGLLLGVGPRWRGFDRLAMAREIACPLMVLHGEADPLCPFEDGRAIAAAAPDGRLVPVAGGDHATLWVDPRFLPIVRDASLAFLGGMRRAGAGVA